jgi:hypothetical protein
MTRLRLWLARLLLPRGYYIKHAPEPVVVAASDLMACPVCNGLRWHWREHDGEWTTGRCPKCWGASGSPTA